MVEVTQADRDAAASGYFAWCSGNPVIPSKMKEGKADDHSMVQAFARHRTEATAALEERVKLLEAALRNMLEHYLGIAHSGDAGFWDPETEPEVISARVALNDPR